MTCTRLHLGHFEPSSVPIRPEQALVFAESQNRNCLLHLSSSALGGEGLEAHQIPLEALGAENHVMSSNF